MTWPDGRRSVLTWRPGTRLADLRDGPLAVIEALRPAGHPAPAAELAVQAGDAVALVWDAPRRPPQPPHTGVIDRDGPARGDRRLGLVTLRFGAHAITADPAAVEHLDPLLDQFPAQILAPCGRISACE